MICKFPTSSDELNENSFVLNNIRKNENKKSKIEATLNKLNKGFLIDDNMPIKRSKNKVTSDSSLIRMNKINQMVSDNDKKILKYTNTS